MGNTTAFPYEVGDPVDPSGTSRSPFVLHEGKKKETKARVSILTYEAAKAGPAATTSQQRASNGFKRLKTLKHPYILSIMDGGPVDEKESTIHIVTEPIKPLRMVLSELASQKDSVMWGIYQLASALKFVNVDGNLVHGNICLDSVFVNQAGDWKLGGFELAGTLEDPGALFKNGASGCPVDPPEVMSGGWGSLGSQIHSFDAWGLGVLIYSIYNGAPTSSHQMSTPGAIPRELIPLYNQLVGGIPEKRCKPTSVLKYPRILKSEYVQTQLFLEEMALKSKEEKDQFFEKLVTAAPGFPSSAARYKLLPELAKAIELTGAGPSGLKTLFAVAKALDEEAFSEEVIPMIAKFFSVPDRQLRVALLENFHIFHKHLTPAIATDKIFPQVIGGFMDQWSVMRELTVKSMVYIAPLLSDKVLQKSVLPNFAKLQMDPEAPIRANTTICLGKIAPSLTAETRKKVLVAAFTRALKDPFMLSKAAGLNAMMATKEYYDANDISRIIPALSPVFVDSDTNIRRTAIKSARVFLDKLEELVESNAESEPADSSMGDNASKASAASAGSDAGLLGNISASMGAMGTFGSFVKTKFGSADPVKNAEPIGAGGSTVLNAPALAAGSAPTGMAANASVQNNAQCNSQASQDSDTFYDAPEADAGDGWDNDDDGFDSPITGKKQVAGSNTNNDGWGDDGWGDDDDFSSPIKTKSIARKNSGSSGSIVRNAGAMSLGSMPATQSSGSMSLGATKSAPATKAPPSSGGWGWDDEPSPAPAAQQTAKPAPAAKKADDWGWDEPKPAAPAAAKQTTQAGSHVKPPAMANDWGWGDDVAASKPKTTAAPTLSGASSATTTAKSGMKLGQSTAKKQTKLKAEKLNVDDWDQW